MVKFIPKQKKEINVKGYKTGQCFKATTRDAILQLVETPNGNLLVFISDDNLADSGGYLTNGKPLCCSGDYVSMKDFKKLVGDAFNDLIPINIEIHEV